jgi:ribosomal protein S18 acetylase RimI-like enzyme
MTRLQIHNAVQADALAIATIQVSASMTAYRDIVSPSYFDDFTVQKRTSVWEEIIADMKGTEHIIIGWEDSNVRGFAHFGRSGNANPGERTGELHCLCVEPRSWRRGYGEQLLAASVTRLAEAGFQTATLRVLSANSQARRFYERNGWRLDEGAPNTGFTVKYRISIRSPS